MEKYKPRKLEKGTIHKNKAAINKNNTSLNTSKLTKQALGAVLGITIVGAAADLLKK